MITELESAQSELISIVGDAHFSADETACRNFAVDGLTPKSVVYPRTAEEVAAVLKCAHHHNLAVIPARNGTQLGIGNIPRRYDIALCLKDLNNVWHYEPADLTASAEAGMKFGDFQELLGRHGLWLPLDPPGGARASVGGILATNGTGALRLLFGTPRDMVLGMKIATTEGKIIKTGGRVVKNVAGYDLTKLFLGSYGSLGVIVEANFKLFPIPTERMTYAVGVPSLDSARDLRRQMLDSPLTPMRMVLMNAEAHTLATQGPRQTEPAHAYVLWVEAGGTQRVLERYTRTLGQLAKTANLEMNEVDKEVAQRAWSLISDIGASFVANYPGCVSARVQLPIASTENFIKEAEEESERGNLRMVVLAQTAAGVVNLHFVEAPEVSMVVRAIGSLREAAQKLRGTLVVERCLAGIKSRVDVWGLPGDDFEIMRGIKQAWDPKGILAPGRFVGGL